MLLVSCYAPISPGDIEETSSMKQDISNKTWKAECHKFICKTRSTVLLCSIKETESYIYSPILPLAYNCFQYKCLMHILC